MFFRNDEKWTGVQFFKRVFLRALQRYPVGRCKLGRGLSVRDRHCGHRYWIRLGAVDLHHAGGHDLDSQAQGGEGTMSDRGPRLRYPREALVFSPKLPSDVTMSVSALLTDPIDSRDTAHDIERGGTRDVHAHRRA